MTQVLRLIISQAESQQTFDPSADMSRNATVVHEIFDCKEFDQR